MHVYYVYQKLFFTIIIITKSFIEFLYIIGTVINYI